MIARGHPGLTYIFNFWHSGTLALSPERQSARMSEIKNVGYNWMALNTLKCNHRTPLQFKGWNLWKQNVKCKTAFETWAESECSAFWTQIQPFELARSPAVPDTSPGVYCARNWTASAIFPRSALYSEHSTAPTTRQLTHCMMQSIGCHENMNALNNSGKLSL